MGYLIKTSIEKIEVIIPQADIITLNTIPVDIIGNKNFYYTIISANLKMQNLGENVQTFGHFYLGYNTPLEKIAIYDENAGIITTRQSNFIINMSHPPNIFGSVSSFAIGLQLEAQLPPTATGDMICTIYYFRNF
jgi:hypothetical protein